MSGNWLEVKETIQALQGNGADDLMELTLTLGAHMLMLTDFTGNSGEAKNKLKKILQSGKAFEKFLELIQAQGGDISFIKNPDKYPKAKYIIDIPAKESGYIQKIDTKEIGTLIIELGGGRRNISDKIDFNAGVELHKKCGERVNTGEKLATIHTNKLIPDVKQRIYNSMKISPKPSEKPQLLIKIIK